MIPKSPGAVLREAVHGVTIPVPGAFNALVGRMLEQAGYDAIYLSGAAFSASVFALPDVGLFTLTELVEQTNCLTRRVEIPVIVDADTGFGEAVHVERTVVELEAAGAAAIQLEDQVLPKRCGHLSGKSLVEPAAMCAKLRAAAAARENRELVIIARTDARGVSGMDDAVRRAELYLEAGADWIFPEALANEEEFAEFARRVQAPLVANMTEFGKSELLSLDLLSELNYAVVLFPVTLLRVAMQAAQQAIDVLRREGTQLSLLDKMQTRQELYDLIEYDAYETRDKEYFGGNRQP